MLISDRLISERPLAATALCFAVLCAVAGAALQWRSQARFIPEVRFTQALAQGDGCIVMLGDSRMVAGIQEEVVTRVLAERGIQTCVANLANGAIEFPEEYITLRRYLGAGKRPSLVVLGHAGDSLLQGPPVDPARLVGNRSLGLAWSVFSDVATLYPGFPLQNFDMGLRFLVTRATPFGVQESWLWQKAQVIQDLVKPAQTRDANEFGAKEDMRALARQLAERATQVHREDQTALHPWFATMRTSLSNAGCPLLMVELPMPAAFREAVKAAPYLTAVDLALADLPRMDASAVVPDEQFSDALHVNQDGARLFSKAVAVAIADRWPVLAKP